MTNFFCVNSIPFSVARDSFSEATEFVGELLQRGANSNLIESRIGSNKRRWTMRSTPLPIDVAIAWVHMLHGNGQTWTFDVDTYSAKGVANSVAGNFTIGAPLSGGVGAGSLSVTTLGLPWVVYLGDKMHSNEADSWLPTKGWTACFWRQNSIIEDGTSASPFYYGIQGATSYVQGAGANPASITQYRTGGFGYTVTAGSFNVGNFSGMTASGDFSLWAKGAAAAADITKQYDELSVYPFEFPSSVAIAWHTALAEHVRLRGIPATAGAVHVGGSALNTTNSGPVGGRQAVGRVRSMKQMGAALAGSAFSPDVYVLDVELIEV